MKEITCEVGGKLYRLVDGGGCRICAFINGSNECEEAGAECCEGPLFRWSLDEREDELCKLRETVARLSVEACQMEDQIWALEENASRCVGIFGVCVESEYLLAGDHVTTTPCGRVVKCV